MSVGSDLFRCRLLSESFLAEENILPARIVLQGPLTLPLVKLQAKLIGICVFRALWRQRGVRQRERSDFLLGIERFSIAENKCFTAHAHVLVRPFLSLRGSSGLTRLLACSVSEIYCT